MGNIAGLLVHKRDVKNSCMISLSMDEGGEKIQLMRHVDSFMQPFVNSVFILLWL